MNNYAKIRSAYDAFSNRFRKKCTHLLANHWSMAFKYDAGATVRITLIEPIFLKDWPYKTESRKHVDILINANELVNIDNMSIIESEVHVSYFKLDNGDCNLLESLHYDFKEKVEPAHPIFHVQLSHEAMGSLPQGFRRCRKLRKLEIPRHQHIRIPTAHMSLVSVLVNIVADHLGSDMLKELISETKNIKNLPQADSSQIFDKISADNKNFWSLHWYAEA